MDQNASVNGTLEICQHGNTVERYMYPTVYSLFFIIGFPANCLSLYVAWVLMKKGNNLAVYLINLSVGDLLYILTLPVWIVMALGYTLNDSLCSIIAVVMFNSFYVGSGFLCCISVDRYLAIVFPLHFARVREVRTTVLVSAIVWLVEIVLHVGLLTYTEAIGNFFCQSYVRGADDNDRHRRKRGHHSSGPGISGSCAHHELLLRGDHQGAEEKHLYCGQRTEKDLPPSLLSPFHLLVGIYTLPGGDVHQRTAGAWKLQRRAETQRLLHSVCGHNDNKQCFRPHPLLSHKWQCQSWNEKTF